MYTVEDSATRVCWATKEKQIFGIRDLPRAKNKTKQNKPRRCITHAECQIRKKNEKKKFLPWRLDLPLTPPFHLHGHSEKERENKRKKELSIKSD